MDLTKLQELRQRILFVVGALIVYRVGTFIPVPGVDPSIMSAIFDQQKGTILDVFNMFSGGALERMSLFALGVMPYISASIIMQLLSVTVPSLEQMKKEGEAGRRKITQYTRYSTVGLSIIQGFFIASGLEGMAGPAGGAIVLEPGIQFKLMTVLTLTSGTAFIMWLGEQMTERGIGNGISLIIFAGIVARMPAAIGNSIQLVKAGEIAVIFVPIMLALMFFL